MKDKKLVLIRDLIIPKGTVFTRAPSKTERHGDDHFETTIGLTDNTSGFVTYSFDPTISLDEIHELQDWFLELKE